MDYLKVKKESKITNEFEVGENIEFSSNIK